jgi:ABC-type multidrug transport system ATPase subunit
MIQTSLESRFLEGTGTQGLRHEEVRYPADFARLVVRTLGLVGPTESEQRALRNALKSVTDWSDERTASLVAIALSPEFRDGLRDEELWAFSEHFGDEAAQTLRDQDDAIDLAGFSSRYGASACLRLLNTLFEVATANGHASVREVRRVEEAAEELDVDPVLVTALLQKHDDRMSSGSMRFALRGERMVIGRSVGVDIVLADPQVAQQHAELTRSGDGWRVVDLGSGRPTVLNHRPVSSSPLMEGDELQVGPYRLVLEGDALRASSERNFSSLSVRNLKRQIGESLLLDDVSFSVFSGEVIAVVGPSGAGKTTLLNAINGVAPADSGDVLMDGMPFHPQLNEDRSLVGIVPQDDLVHAELSVEESLFYSGRLRLSADASDDDVREQVDRVLDELELGGIRGNRIGDVLRRGISGGQRKRVNLGQELMTKNTKVLFLDEPTSGLDPRASQDIARRVRQLADSGRIVFLVTHDLTPEIMAQVDHMLVMAPGGRLAFFGPTEEACRWFGAPTPDRVFNRFADRSPEQWAADYRNSSAARTYVETREHLLELGGVASPANEEPRSHRRSFWTQVRAQLGRYAKVKSRDTTGMAVLAAQPPLLALVMGVVFPKPTTALMFMLALSCLWFGMSASVRELIADRVIWLRERRVGVGVLPYMLSKVVVLGALVGVQCLAFSSLLFWVLNMGDYGFSVVQLGAVGVLTGMVGMSLGLVVSGSWTSSEAAVGTLPLLLIPQITFSSIMVSVRSMSDLAQFCSWFTVQRYAFDAVIKCGDELAYFKYGQWQRQRVRGFLYELGLKDSSSADDMGLTLEQLYAFMGGFVLFFLLVATGLVWVRGRKG